MTGASHMEPMLPQERRELVDALLDLVAEASAFMASVKPALARPVGDLVRSMNCYYSNLIEGHSTQLVDIEKAMREDFSTEPEKRDLQLEAKAHIDVQGMIDHGEMPHPAVSVDGIRWIHREFCSRLPSSLLQQTDPVTGRTFTMLPGELRTRHVKVGRHEAPEPEALGELLRRFVQAYTSRMLGRVGRLSAIPAAHHRLAWIHPFVDGNGRVTRLMSHAMLRELGVGSELWSVSRGLARNVDRYKALLQAADEPRRGDRDGRGNLTEAGLLDFCAFFIDVCADQVRFMRRLLDLDDLGHRIRIWTEEEIAAKRLPKGAWAVLREAVTFGELPRSRVAELTGHQERQARTVLKSLLDRGLLVSDSPKGPVRIGFPAYVVERWFPGLYQPILESKLSSEPEPAVAVREGIVAEIADYLERIAWEGRDDLMTALEAVDDDEILSTFLEHLPHEKNPYTLLSELGVEVVDPSRERGIGGARHDV